MARILSEKDVNKRRLRGELKGLKSVKKPAKVKDPMADLLSHVKQIVSSSENVMEANRKLMTYMLEKLVKIQAPDKPPARDATFTIKRDSDGFIEEVYLKHNG
jgi:hypothetical protein